MKFTVVEGRTAFEVVDQFFAVGDAEHAKIGLGAAEGAFEEKGVVFVVFRDQQDLLCHGRKVS